MPRGDDVPGGDNISVSVYKNGELVYKRDCVLTGLRGNGNVRIYKTDDTDLFNASKNVTSVEIAEKLLKTKGNR
jgi:hypothetical protein